MKLSPENPDAAYSAMVAALVQQRRKLGLGRDAVADLLGLPAADLARLEAGKPRAPLPFLLRWCDSLGFAVRLGAGSLPAVTESAIRGRGGLARRMSARASGEAAA